MITFKEKRYVFPGLKIGLTTDKVEEKLQGE